MLSKCKLFLNKQFKKIDKYEFNEYVVIILLIIIACLITIYHIHILETFFGALFGAYVAFCFNSAHQKKLQLDIERSSLRKTLHRLKIMLKKMIFVYEVNFKDILLPDTVMKEFFYENKENKITIDWCIDNFTTIRPYKYLSCFEADIVKIDFVVGYENGEKYLNEIMCANEQFQSLYQILNDRNILYDNYLEKTQRFDKKEIFNDSLINVIGEKHFSELILYTRMMCKELFEGIVVIHGAFENLANFSKEILDFKPGIMLELGPEQMNLVSKLKTFDVKV